jgi:superfamily II DNA/RNA helicase
VIYESQKIPLVKMLLKSKTFKSILIFCSKKINVKALTRDLKRAGFPQRKSIPTSSRHKGRKCSAIFPISVYPYSLQQIS